MQKQLKAGEQRTKDDQSPVTVADYGALLAVCLLCPGAHILRLTWVQAHRHWWLGACGSMRVHVSAWWLRKMLTISGTLIAARSISRQPACRDHTLHRQETGSAMAQAITGLVNETLQGSATLSQSEVLDLIDLGNSQGGSQVSLRCQALPSCPVR